MTIFKRFDLTDYGDCLIVTDCKIAELYSIRGDNVYFLPQGEQAKTFSCVEAICRWFLDKALQRDGRVVAIGGGSVGDAVGFACSAYKRGGIKLTHVPTTLIAQIDSSVGGKTAINVGDVKNAVGSYYSADTAIDVNFLKTLDGVQMKSGMGELLKYRMLSDKIDALFNGEITEEIIKACVEFKLKICEIDPYDGEIRHRLNFGHTLGHAMELYYGLPHGYAVANGIYYETLLARKLGKCDSEYSDKWTGVAKEQFEIKPLNDRILNATLNDKKNGNNAVCFVLPPDFEQVYVTLTRLKDLLCYD